MNIMDRFVYECVYGFDTPFAETIAEIMIKEWGYNYTEGFKYRSIDEYKLWKKDSLFYLCIDQHEKRKLAGMIAYEKYNMADIGRWTPCICCLWVHDDYRNMGIGTELLNKMVNIAKDLAPPELHRKEVFLWFVDKQPSLIRFFENANWRYLIDWNYLNRKVHIMYRDLRDV